MSNRFMRLAAVIGCAALAVTAAILVSSASSPAEPSPDVRPAATDLAGIPETKGVLGDPGAPITVTEFVDPQCPVCAAAARDVLPTLIDDYIRPGTVKLDAEVLHFLGPDSVTAARFAEGARDQDKLWPFLETFFASQGAENSGYVTPDFLAGVAEQAGVDAAAATAHADTPTAGRALDAANAEAQRLGVTGTPTFVVTRDGHEQLVPADQLLAVLAS